MAKRFGCFTSLSAELRTTIWHLALRQEDEDEDSTGRHIELYSYDPGTRIVSIVISRPYPTLFTVCREARYESAKVMNGKWTRIHARYNNPTGRSLTAQLEICINFKLDSIDLHACFLAPPLQSISALWSTPEQYRLEMFAQLFDYQTLQCIEKIKIEAHPPPTSGKLDFNAWWKGEGIEIFASGTLRRVSIMTKERAKSSISDYSRWLEAAVRDEIHESWAERGQVNVPSVEMLNV